MVSSRTIAEYNRFYIVVLTWRYLQICFLRVAASCPGGSVWLFSTISTTFMSILSVFWAHWFIPFSNAVIHWFGFTGFPVPVNRVEINSSSSNWVFNEFSVCIFFYLFFYFLFIHYFTKISTFSYTASLPCITMYLNLFSIFHFYEFWILARLTSAHSDQIFVLIIRFDNPLT